MKNSADQGERYPQRKASGDNTVLELQNSSASVDNALLNLQNSSYPTKTEINNCFIIHSKYLPVLEGVSSLRSLFFYSPKITQSRSKVFFGQRFNNLQRALLLTSLVQYDKDSFQIWSTAAHCGELCV